MMIDSRIALGLKPMEFVSPLDSAGKALSLRSLIDQRALRDMQMHQQQQLHPLQMQRAELQMSELQRQAAESERVRGLTAQIPGLLQSGDTQGALSVLAQLDPKSALTRLLPAPNKRNTVVSPGSTVLDQNNQPVFTAPPATKEPTQTELFKLLRERAALPPGSPERALFDQKIRKLTTHQPAVNVYSSSMTAGIDAQGNPIFAQGSGQPGVPPRVVPGIFPPERANVTKAKEAERQEDLTAESVRTRIKEMTRLLQQNSGVVGPAGIARRTAEAAGGVVAPNIATPALDYQNNMRLLLSDVRKLVEKDPNLSSQEREALYETLGGGTLQTPGSAVRSLTNVMNYVEGKRAAPSRGSQGADKFTAGQTYQDANGNKAKYLGNGQWEPQ